ncbi:pilus assembly protein PilP [Desulfonatronum thiosulfatophilum]|uniref:pilus assembly protein PilP n=1 Tax=Desulfonatronum thiosulfatophilum TaxID=617002 RepID=UPI00137AAC96|nr:pilus assembly protein PilP [Desulfonatronum thiosulfatophilum]
MFDSDADENTNNIEPDLMGTALELPLWLQTPDGYWYRPDDKPDPFRPFVRPIPPEESFQPQIPQRALTPLERVEATQLRVVGILWNELFPERGLAAMVEMPDGKGYVLRPGMFVGQYGGAVHQITTGEVVIVEQGRDIAGREQTREIILRLNPSRGDGHDS